MNINNRRLGLIGVTFISVLGFLHWGNGAHAATPPPAKHYSALPFFAEPTISSDGRRLAFKLNTPDKSMVAILELSKGKDFFPLFIGEKQRVNWTHWIADDLLLISVRFFGQRYNVDTIETRLVVFNTKTKDLDLLFKPRSDEKTARYVSQIQDNVVDFLPDEPDKFLLLKRDKASTSFSVYKVDARSGRSKRYHRGSIDVQSWITDADHQVRFGWGFQQLGDGYVAKAKTLDGKWHKLTHLVEPGDVFYKVVGFVADNPDLLYVRSNFEGGRINLYTYDIAQQVFLDQVAGRSDSDVNAVTFNNDGHLSIIGFEGDTVPDLYLDQELAMLNRSMTKAFPGKDVDIVAITPDRQKLVLLVSASNSAPDYYLYDRQTKVAGYLASQYPDLSRSKGLMQTSEHSYPSRDGLSIPAFVTLPNSAQAGETVPFIVYPHGGPTARDFNRFDPWVQFFVSRGWGVLQMNFRGSTGYGIQFQDAGDGQWGQKMQDDITDGVNWLIANKMATRDQICIVGASYGGYAALMGTLRTPDLYACAVSINGVTDIKRWILSKRNYIGGRQRMENTMGDLHDDGNRQKLYSPIRRAEDVGAPVLLVHGEDDRRVDVSHSRRMAKALKKANKHFKYVELENEDHYLSNQNTRQQAFREVDEFLNKHLN